MTSKQESYINSLLRSKNYDATDSLVQGFINNFELSTQQASDLIGYLLSCENKQQQPNRVKMSKAKLKTIKALVINGETVNVQVSNSGIIRTWNKVREAFDEITLTSDMEIIYR